jgi:hypothetical protein
MIKNTESGSGLVEVVVASAIISLVAVSFLGSFALLSRFHQRDMLAIKAQLAAEEGLEAIRLIKSSSWSSLSSIPVNQDRHFALATSSWSATTTVELIDGLFYRSFRLGAVSRDSSDSIVASGGTVDPNTLLVEVSVSWPWRAATSTVTYKTYVTSL